MEQKEHFQYTKEYKLLSLPISPGYQKILNQVHSDQPVFSPKAMIGWIVSKPLTDTRTTELNLSSNEIYLNAMSLLKIMRHFITST